MQNYFKAKINMKMSNQKRILTKPEYSKNSTLTQLVIYNADTFNMLMIIK